MKTPYDNKKHYDSGRLRHKISFLIDVVSDDGYGGSTVTGGFLLGTWAGKEEVSTYTEAGLNAGQTQYNRFQYFVIRNRRSFTPRKDMQLIYDGYSYIIRDVKQLDDPCTFLKILCVASEEKVNLEGTIYAGGTNVVPNNPTAIKALEAIFTPDSSNFTYNTGNNKVFTIAVKSGRDIFSVYDLTSEEFITELFTKSSMAIDGVDYDVYTMQNALPFTSNHIHQVTLL